MANYLLFADREPTAEVYSAAADRNQAAIVFTMAKRMRDLSEKLRERSESFRRSMTVPETLSVYEVLSSDVPTKDGLSASGIIFDELHTQKTGDLWDVLTTSTGAREQPLTIAITTAGVDRHSICWEQHDYADKIRRGHLEDAEFLGLIFAADPDDDWTSEETWKKANPSLGETVSVDYIRAACNKAKASPARQNTFRRLHLNQWTQQETRWIDLAKWDASAGEVNIDELTGKPGFGGLDLATTTDLAAWIMLFPVGDSYKIIPRFYMPEDNIQARVRKDRVPYDVWLREGYIVATPGNVIDYAFIREDVNRDSDRFRIQDIGYDRWNAAHIIQELEEDGHKMTPVGQGFASMAGPTKELEKLIFSKKLHHGGNPILRWNADNVVVRQDPAGNLKPDKGRSQEKIDGIVGTIIALDRALRSSHGAGLSVYEERGIRTT